MNRPKSVYAVGYLDKEKKLRYKVFYDRTAALAHLKDNAVIEHLKGPRDELESYAWLVDEMEIEDWDNTY